MQSNQNPKSDAFKENRDARQNLKPTVMDYLPWAECWDLRHYYREGEGRMACETFQEEFTRNGTQTIKRATEGSGTRAD